MASLSRDHKHVNKERFYHGKIPFADESLPFAESTEEHLVTMQEVRPNAIVERVGKLIGRLQSLPNMGNPRPHKMLRDRSGDSIRAMAVDQYPLVYTHDEGSLRVIALVWRHG